MSSAPASPACTRCTGCAGIGFSVRVLERGTGVGGTWYWNRYPGARCDIESVDYCYSFSEECSTSGSGPSATPAQPEILRYLDHVADRFDLRRDIELGTEVTDRGVPGARQPVADRHRPRRDGSLRGGL